MHFNLKNSFILNKLKSPLRHNRLILSDDLSSLTDEISGDIYEIRDSIPVFIYSKSESDEDKNYVEHYIIDSEEFDYFEERFGGTADDERRVREYILSFIAKDRKEILDVGSGRAWVAGELCKKGISVCSVDISFVNTHKALQKYDNENHAAVVADAYALPFADESFDCVVSSEVIEHVHDPQGFIIELLRCVKRGGNLIITTPYKEKLIYNLCIHCNKKTPQNAHLHTFDEKILASFAADNSIEQKYKTFGNKALLHLRTYKILRFFPFTLWRAVDSMFNHMIDKRAHIIFRYHKV